MADAINSIAALATELRRRAMAFAADENRLGYFAALYALMTSRVAAGITAERFDDPQRAEYLACHFAGRYLSALDRATQHEDAPACWSVSFQEAKRRRPIILQHLLLGMNAHINYDLAIATAEVAAGTDIAAMRHDFLEINAVIAELLDDVQARITSVSPWMGIAVALGGRKEDAVLNFSVRVARDAAWDVATKLTPMAIAERAGPEEMLDRSIAEFATVITQPGLLCTAAMIPVRARERASVADVIATLIRDEL